MATASFTLSNHGSVCLLNPNDGEADMFLRERVGDEAQWWGGMLVIEPRYVANIVADLEANGYTTEPA